MRNFRVGRPRILVATNVAARGLDVSHIGRVINYDLPELPEGFIHRVGRTGRAGKRGVASTLFLREQRAELVRLERTLGVRVERMTLAQDSLERREKDGAGRGDRLASRGKSRLIRLPGEFFQAQMQV